MHELKNRGEMCRRNIYLTLTRSQRKTYAEKTSYWNFKA